MPRVPGRATGIGSWPGTDVVDAMRTTFGELGEPPGLPYLPELPARGPGADLLGRAAAMLVDLARAQASLRQDLDLLAEVAEGYSGDLKVQVAGPWTMAAGIWLPRLERAVVDPGACRDLVGSLAEGVARHVEEVRRLVPGATVVVQLDEPGLPAVLRGELPTASGFGRLRAVEEPTVVDGLREVLAAAVRAGAAGTAVHSCAAEPPIQLLRRTGAGAISLDVRRLGTAGWEAVGEAVDGGAALWAGIVPAVGDPGRPERAADAVGTPWSRLGLPTVDLAAVVVTPTCGLAGSSPATARAAIATAVSAASLLAERAQE